MNYTEQAEKIANQLGIKLVCKDPEYKKHFHNDKDSRYVFRCALKRGKRSYSFDFGQSLSAGSKEPSLYDVLTCLQKYDVGSFEEFCGEFGYDEDSRVAEKTYKAVVKEYEAMQQLFTDEEIELLQEIQ